MLVCIKLDLDQLPVVHPAVVHSLYLMRFYENDVKHCKQTMCNGVRREADEK